MPIVYNHITDKDEGDKEAQTPGEPQKTTTKQRILSWIQTSLSTLVMTGFIISFAFGLSVEIVTLLGSILLVIVDTIVTQDGETAKKLFSSIQWDVILVFAALFIVVHTFNFTRVPHFVWEFCYPLMQVPIAGISFYALVLILLSTLVSNVPVVLMVAPEMKSKLSWIILAWAITVGGNFTVISSAANIIVDEKANSMSPRLRLSLWRYSKFGIPATIIVAMVGTYLILALGHAYGYELEL